MNTEIDTSTATELSPAGQSMMLVSALAFFSIPGIIATIRKDTDKGRIWAFGLLGPFTIYITWIKALVWALRPAGQTLDEYKMARLKAKQKVQTIKQEIESQKRVKGGTGALKSTVENGDDVTGGVFLYERFGWGSVRLYKNGYIYSSTRMSAPEKLVAISGNTDLAVAQKKNTQLSGAILTIVTENDVYTIGDITWGKSDYLTPSTIKSLTRLVAAGNALIGK